MWNLWLTDFVPKNARHVFDCDPMSRNPWSGADELFLPGKVLSSSSGGAIKLIPPGKVLSSSSGEPVIPPGTSSSGRAEKLMLQGKGMAEHGKVLSFSPAASGVRQLVSRSLLWRSPFRAHLG